ncbi:MAG TPA: DUF1080 domain-containing protein [Membranihabitans sp.]|nr:DUF1080 domain-containing protein [Membranihabitans sp.]
MRKASHGISFSVRLLGGWILAFTGFYCIFSCQSNHSTDEGSRESERVDDWIVLFDGTSLDQWRTIGSDSIFTSYWKIEDGILKKIERGKVPVRADGQPLQGGDLMTREAFDNFELMWEWALFEEGNSGLKYNVSEEMSVSSGSRHSALGFEYQMIDDHASKYNDLKPEQFSGALYDLLPAMGGQIKGNGEFNTSRIRVEGNEVTHWLNGEKVLNYQFGSEALVSAYNKSKFAEIPGFIDKRKGHIVLQDHITEAWFRNIRIKRL